MAEKFNLQEALAAITASMAAVSPNMAKNTEETKASVAKYNEETRTRIAAMSTSMDINNED